MVLRAPSPRRNPQRHQNGPSAIGTVIELRLRPMRLTCLAETAATGRRGYNSCDTGAVVTCSRGGTVLIRLSDRQRVIVEDAIGSEYEIVTEPAELAKLLF